MSLSPPRRLVRGLIADQRGGTAIVIAVIAAIVIAVTSLGTEVVLALDTQRRMQSAADSAAISAANAQAIGFPSPYTDEAYALAADQGFSSATHTCDGNPTVYVGPPCDGSNPTYIQVLIRQPFDLHLAKVLFPSNLNLHGSAIASPPNSTNGSCTLALKQGSKTVVENGGGSITYGGCAIAANSNAADAVWANGGANGQGSITADTIYSGGSPGFGGSGNINAGSPATSCLPVGSNSNCVSGAAPRLNPYADTTIPTCNGPQPALGAQSLSLIATAGCYKGINLNGCNTTNKPGLILGPGTYVIDGTNNNNGGVSVSGGCTLGLSGAGVTIFLEGSNAQVTIASNSNVTLVAPTPAQAAVTGGTAGLLFYSAAAGSSSLIGGGSMTLTGAIALPNQDVTFAGNTSTIASNLCTVIIASTLTFSGTTNVGSANCTNFGTKTVQNPATLVD